MFNTYKVICRHASMRCVQILSKVPTPALLCLNKVTLCVALLCPGDWDPVAIIGRDSDEEGGGLRWPCSLICICLSVPISQLLGCRPERGWAWIGRDRQKAVPLTSPMALVDSNSLRECLEWVNEQSVSATRVHSFWLRCNCSTKCPVCRAS